ncbi:methionyl-tRNA formyltransferase [Myxococcota bacterium]|nr:methionyl-tRNA formyltransferase [Myxococcota bacterium]
MPLRIALFGQAPFGRDVLVSLSEAGHDIVGVYAPPDGARPDPLAEEAESQGLPLFRHRRFRRKGEAIPELVEEFRGLGAELNVLAFVTVILPPEIVEGPARGSLCFHPSLLPRFRGGAALAWQIILGESESGVTVFQPDAGVDTGPIVVQRGGVEIRPDDTAASLYFERLYPLGLEAITEAVARVEAGNFEATVQDESRATFQGLVGDDESRIDWQRDWQVIDRLVRGCDPTPGAHARLERTGEVVRLFGGSGSDGDSGEAPGTVLGLQEARLQIAVRGGRLNVAKLRVGDAGKVTADGAGLVTGDRLV